MIAIPRKLPFLRKDPQLNPHEGGEVVVFCHGTVATTSGKTDTKTDLMREVVVPCHGWLTTTSGKTDRGKAKLYQKQK